MARSSSDAALALPAARLPRLQACGRHTKTSTIQMLMELQSSGALAGESTERELRRQMQHATEAHANAMTPYGKVVQGIRLDSSKLKTWEICHPFALLWYLTSISVNFADMMRKCTTSGRPLRLVVYVDGLIPGNPFRPEKSRKLECIYWTFVDWPGWLLSRTFAWPCLSIIRSSVVEDLEGGMSYLARVILKIFFPDDGDSFERGILVNLPSGEPLLVKAIFVGWLADLLGHKEITQWKGTGGNMCCHECANIHKNARGGSDVRGYGTDCSNMQNFDRLSSEDIYILHMRRTCRAILGAGHNRIRSFGDRERVQLCPKWFALRSLIAIDLSTSGTYN